MRDVAIIGVGMTRFGELWDRSIRSMGIEAGLGAIQDAGIYSTDLEALYMGNMASGLLIKQEHLAPLIGDFVGMTKLHLPATRIEGADASGGLALREAYTSVASGLHDVVLVGGMEKMTDVGDARATGIMASAADQEWETFYGATLPSLYAMMARRHMHEFGTTQEMLASVAVNNHYHGSMNPMAQYQRAIKIEMALGAGITADPLRMFDCAPLSDGAAALVLCPMDRAKEFTDAPIRIRGSGLATDSLALHDREDITSMAATRMAAQRAYRRGNVTHKDIDVAEVHDSFSIGQIIAAEDLGFFKQGSAGQACLDGEMRIGGSMPINTSGGMKARGFPPGAAGIAQAVELVHQLRGKAGARQVKDARIGLAQNVGGTGATSVVHILEAI
jgi:acetyl-CoA C-acetyltransferase